MGGILPTERFSHTTFGTPLYHNHEWLTQLLFHGLFRAGGPLLLALFCAACVIAAVAGAWRLVQGSSEARFGFLALMMVGSVVEWAIRPQVISLAFFVIASAPGDQRTRSMAAAALPHLVQHARRGDCWAVIAGCSALEAVLWSRDRARRAIAHRGGLLPRPAGHATGLALLAAGNSSRSDGARSAYSRVPVAVRAGPAAFLDHVGRPVRHASAEGVNDRHVVTRHTHAGIGGIGLRGRRRDVGPQRSTVLPCGRTGTVAAVASADQAPATEAGTDRGDGSPRCGHNCCGIAVAMAWRGGGALLGWKPMSASAVEAVRRCQGSLFNGYADGGILAWFIPERRIFIDSRGVEAYPIQLLLRSRGSRSHRAVPAALSGLRHRLCGGRDRFAGRAPAPG